MAIHMVMLKRSGGLNQLMILLRAQLKCLDECQVKRLSLQYKNDLETSLQLLWRSNLIHTAKLDFNGRLVCPDQAQ
jgi:hypothetical protein